MKAHPILLFFLFLTGCVTPQSISYPMSFEECAKSDHCTISGTVIARQGEHAWMGELTLADGQCISVSLPRRIISELRATGPRQMVVSGRSFGDPSRSIEEVVTLEIEGRKIGLGLCSDFFVFVSNRS